MAKVTPIQESFAAGEISPKLLGRRSIEGYRAGATTMRNMIADARGPGISRKGFRFSRTVPGYDVRLGLINIGLSSDLLLIWSDLLLTISSILGSLPASNLVSNGDFLEGNTGWTEFKSGGGARINFNVGDVELNSANAGLVRISQQITLAATGIVTVIVETTATTNYRVKIGDADNGTEYLDILTAEARYEIDVDISATTTPWISVENDSADGGTQNTMNVSTVLVTEDTSELTFVTPYPEDELRNLYFVESPDGKTLYVLHPNFPPQKLVSDDVGALTFGPVVFTAPPAIWAGENYPGSGTVFEGRLWLGGTPTTRQTFWGSKAGALEDFTIGVNADDAMEFTLSRFGAIEWMMGTKNLLIGTAQGEHVVSSEAGVITPTDIKIDQQSAYGSSKVQPVQVGDQVFYVSLDGTKVRAMQYEWSADNWLSKDLTFFSEHITKSGIREMSWAPHPNNILVCTLNDGTMAWLSYERGENVWGWHKHDTQGIVKDTTTGLENGFSFTAAGIIRVEGEIHVEVLFESADVHMDSWHEQEDTITPFTVVDGLEYLEGFTVQILADGAVYPDQVVTGGQITLPVPVSYALVGLQYNPKLATLPIESGSPTGSSLAYLKRYNRLIIGLLDSALPLINGVRGPDRTPSTPMNEVEPNRTGQVEAYQLGWSEGAIVTIEQDLPLALTVLYIGGELPQDVL